MKIQQNSTQKIQFSNLIILSVVSKYRKSAFFFIGVFIISTSFAQKRNIELRVDSVMKLASLIRPIEELKDFQKIMLKPGESKIIHFSIDTQKLSYYNKYLDWVAESGTFNLMIGTSSADIRLSQNFELPNN